MPGEGLPLSFSSSIFITYVLSSSSFGLEFFLLPSVVDALRLALGRAFSLFGRLCAVDHSGLRQCLPALFRRARCMVALVRVCPSLPFHPVEGQTAWGVWLRVDHWRGAHSTRARLRCGVLYHVGNRELTFHGSAIAVTQLLLPVFEELTYSTMNQLPPARPVSPPPRAPTGSRRVHSHSEWGRQYMAPSLQFGSRASSRATHIAGAALDLVFVSSNSESAQFVVHHFDACCANSPVCCSSLTLDHFLCTWSLRGGH